MERGRKEEKGAEQLIFYLQVPLFDGPGQSIADTIAPGEREREEREGGGKHVFLSFHLKLTARSGPRRHWRRKKRRRRGKRVRRETIFPLSV